MSVYFPCKGKKSAPKISRLMRTNSPSPVKGVPAWRRLEDDQYNGATTAALYFHHSGCRKAA